MRLATIALASFLHQAEAHLESSSITHNLFRFRRARDGMTEDMEEKAYFTWFGETLLYVSCRIWRCNNGLVGLVFVYLNEAWHYAECVSRDVRLRLVPWSCI